MSTYILTSMFANGFMRVAKVFQQKIEKRDKFAFVASEFEALHEKTDMPVFILRRRMLLMGG